MKRTTETEANKEGSGPSRRRGSEEPRASDDLWPFPSWGIQRAGADGRNPRDQGHLRVQGAAVSRGNLPFSVFFLGGGRTESLDFNINLSSGVKESIRPAKSKRRQPPARPLPAGPPLRALQGRGVAQAARLGARGRGAVSALSWGPAPPASFQW